MSFTDGTNSVPATVCNQAMEPSDNILNVYSISIGLRQRCWLMTDSYPSQSPLDSNGSDGSRVLHFNILPGTRTYTITHSARKNMAWQLGWLCYSAAVPNSLVILALLLVLDRTYDVIYCVIKDHHGSATFQLSCQGKIIHSMFEISVHKVPMYTIPLVPLTHNG